MEQSQNLPQRHVKERSTAAHRMSHCTRQSPCCIKSLPQHPNIQSCHLPPPAYNLLLVQRMNTTSTMQAHAGVQVQLHTLMSALGRYSVTFMCQASLPLGKQTSILFEKGDESVQSPCGHFGEDKYLSLLPKI
jgi:hypothetical protein